MAPYDDWRRRIDATLAAAQRRGWSVEALELAPPATEEQLLAVEAQIGRPLAPSFRRVLAEWSQAAYMHWSRPTDAETPFPDVFCGVLSWELEAIAPLEDVRLQWVEGCFPDPTNAYDRVWHEAQAIQHIPNGDLIGIRHADGAVVYLSHEDGEGHGHLLGRDFEDAITRWSKVGFVGPEEWQWTMLGTSQTAPIDPDCENAKRLRTWLEIAGD